MGPSLRSLVVVLAASCGGPAGPPAETPTPVEPATAPPPHVSSASEPARAPTTEASQVARQFWVHLASRDYESAIALASYPFDLDAHDGCVEDVEGMRQAFAADPLPPDAELVVGEVRPISPDMDLSTFHEHWRERVPSWTGPEAPCLGEPASGGDAAEILYFLVDFTLNGREVGSLTRVRCAAGACTVAGTDN